MRFFYGWQGNKTMVIATTKMSRSSGNNPDEEMNSFNI